MINIYVYVILCNDVLYGNYYNKLCRIVLRYIVLIHILYYITSSYIEACYIMHVATVI